MKVVRWDASAQRFAADKMQKVPLFASDRFFCDLYCLEPGQSQKIHAHAGSDKVYLVAEGEGRFSIGGEQRRLTSGEATFAPADQAHGVANDSKARLVVLTFMAPPPA